MKPKTVPGSVFRLKKENFIVPKRKVPLVSGRIYQKELAKVKNLLLE